VSLPPGYSLSQGCETEQQAEKLGQTELALGVALLHIYYELVVQFGS
jgi:multidrug efflux pump subunit AcrB